MAKTMSEIRIDQTDINAVAVSVAVAGSRLTGTVLENKQVFDAYPEMVGEHLNDLCDYVDEQSPTGDTALDYTATEILNIISAIGCTEADITL